MAPSTTSVQKYLAALIVLTVLFSGKIAFASVLSPGTITTCGEITATGTYTLGNNIATTTGPCLTITSSGVAASTTIDGAGLYTITGDITGDGANFSDAGHNFTLKNLTVIGTTTANGVIDDNSCSFAGGNGGSIVVLNSTTTVVIARNGGSAGCFDGGNPGSIIFSTSTADLVSISGGDAYIAGNGGTVIITASTIGTVLADGGVTSGGTGAASGNGGTVLISNSSVATTSASYGGDTYTTGVGGAITMSAGSLNLSSAYIAALGGGTLTLNYTTLNHTNLVLSALAVLTLNGPGNAPGNVGSFNGGLIGTIPGESITTSADCYFGIAGTYTFGADITGDCIVSNNGVTIDGSGHILTGSVTGSGYDINLQNITVTGAIVSTGAAGQNGGAITVSNATTTSIVSSGASSQGNAGDITITNSVFTSISASADYGDINHNGVGGDITISGTNLDLSNKTIFANGRRTLGPPINFSGGTDGTLTLNYTTLSHINLTLSKLANLTLNGPGGVPGDMGAFAGGALVLPGETITDASQCNLTFANTYYLGANITGDCHVTADGVVLDGAGLYIVNGNVIGNAVSSGNPGFDFTLKNITVTGSITSTGYYGNNGGDITISNATTTSISSKGTCLVSTCANGGTVTVGNSRTTIIDTSGGSSYTYARTGGNGGTITVSTSTTGALISNGGLVSENGGTGGMIVVTNSFENASSTNITANGGNILGCEGSFGDGGSVTLIDSTYTGTVSSNQGTSEPGYCTNSSGSRSGSSGSVRVVGQYILTPVSVQPALVISSPVVAVAAPSTRSTSRALVISDAPTTTPAALVVSTPPPSNTNNFGTRASAVAQKIVETTTTIVNSPASKTVQAVGLFSGLASAFFAFPGTILATPLAGGESILIPIRLWGLVLTGLGIRKRSRRWGTVYDSVTKLPLDPVLVTVKDENGKVVTESITDSDGRYGFLLPDGTYFISVNKTNYEFPSKKMLGKSSDELYKDLYFGEPVTIRGGEVLDRNIPMDQLNFDWNEYAKKAQSSFLFHSRNEKVMAGANKYIYGIGLIVSVLAAVTHPHTYNILILLVYSFIFLPLEFMFKRKKLGSVIDKTTHQPLSFAIVNVTAYDHETILRSGVCDARGRYYCIVPKGDYYVDIKQKNQDGSYTKVYESSLLSNKTGILNSNFVV